MVQGKRVVRLMGTIIELTIEHEAAESVLDELVTRLTEYEHRFSANDPSSELMQVNCQSGKSPVVVHPELYELIKLGTVHSQAPGSQLNIAIGPLVQSWRIGFSDARVPSEAELNAKLALTDPSQIVLDDATHSVFLTEPGMAIDLGSLAKGYIGDRLLAYLQSVGARSGLLNLGGNLLVFGPSSHPQGLWRIGIRDPQGEREEYRLILATPATSVVTSGIYERQLVTGNHRYHHLIDRYTGHPLETDLASLTILSQKSVDGEIWTTRLFGKDPDEILAILAQTPGIEGILIMKDRQVLTSAQVADHIIWQ